MLTRSRVVYIYDPNGFNPYGTELAAVLDELPVRVVHLAHSQSSVLEGGASKRAVVFGRSLSVAIRLCWALLAVLLSRGVVILCWVPSKWHFWIAMTLARTCRRIYFVDHNPHGSRAARGPISLNQRARLLSHPKIVPVLHHGCVPDPETADAYQGFVFHPSYRRTVTHYSLNLATSKDEGVCLFFGSARVDKGIHFLPDVSHRLKQLGASLRIRVGKCGMHEQALLRTCSGDVQIGGSRHLSDQQLIAEISRASVVVAPYSEVTTSGTAIMAATIGTPVVMFDSPAMSWLMPKGNMVPKGEWGLLSQKAAKLALESGSEGFAMDPDTLDLQCRGSWTVLLDGVI
jgi:hypothetical protein